MANTLPPTPYNSPIADNRGLITVAWQGFFKELFIRVGGTSGTSNSQLLALITNLQTDITALQTADSGFSQGRAL